MNELNERDFYEEPGVNIFEILIDGKKEWVRKTTIDGINASLGQPFAGITALRDGSYSRLAPFQNTPIEGAPPIADSAGLNVNTKVDALTDAPQTLTASILGTGWVMWVGVGAVTLIGLNLLRKKGK